VDDLPTFEMSKASRDKGKRGERELAQLFTGEGYPAKRFGFAQTRFGGCEGADVVCADLPWLHIECKRYNKFMGSKLRAAIEQSERDRSAADIASVFHREDDSKWFVTMEAVEFFRIVRGEFG
jgi:Holliday junction resolvase